MCVILRFPLWNFVRTSLDLLFHDIPKGPDDESGCKPLPYSVCSLSWMRREEDVSIIPSNILPLPLSQFRPSGFPSGPFDFFLLAPYPFSIFFFFFGFFAFLFCIPRSSLDFQPVSVSYYFDNHMLCSEGCSFQWWKS